MKEKIEKIINGINKIIPTESKIIITLTYPLKDIKKFATENGLHLFKPKSDIIKEFSYDYYWCRYQIENIEVELISTERFKIETKITEI